MLAYQVQTTSPLVDAVCKLRQLDALQLSVDELSKKDILNRLQRQSFGLGSSHPQTPPDTSHIAYAADGLCKQQFKGNNQKNGSQQLSHSTMNNQNTDNQTIPELRSAFISNSNGSSRLDLFDTTSIKNNTHTAVSATNLSAASYGALNLTSSMSSPGLVSGSMDSDPNHHHHMVGGRDQDVGSIGINRNKKSLSMSMYDVNEVDSENNLNNLTTNDFNASDFIKSAEFEMNHFNLPLTPDTFEDNMNLDLDLFL